MTIKRFFRLKNSEQGIGLVETIVALGVSLIVITSLVSLSVYVLRASQENRMMLTATDKANEQLELLRAKRDTTTWDAFTLAMASCSSPTSVCVLTSLSGAPQAVTNTTQINPNEVLVYFWAEGTGDLRRIHVEGAWMSGSTIRKVYNSTDLSNWRVQ